MSNFKNIPTNIISGFLGAGKTTAIQYLLKHKPASQVWAVIVNEFGQVGIDGALLKNNSVEIKEIPGGCLCCVGSQSLNVGLNQIIRSVKPERILIEPTGLGHPAKLIESLMGEFYINVLDLKAVINLVDARNLNNPRYLKNQTFMDQSKLADILVATKLDTYSENDINGFFEFGNSFAPEKSQLEMVEQGQLKLEWLELARHKNRSAKKDFSSQVSSQLNGHSHSHTHQKIKPVNTGNDSHWSMLEGYADGYHSLGWKLHASFIFHHDSVIDLIRNLFSDEGVERVKGVVNTNNGWLMLNMTQQESEIQNSSAHTNTILEIISAQPINAEDVNSVLLACRKNA